MSSQNLSTANLLPFNVGMSAVEVCILELHRVGAIKFGQFILKNNVKSPIYFDLRVIVSYPPILDLVSDIMWRVIAASGEKFNFICGVAYTALPIASVISIKQKVPMLVLRKEVKGYGTKKRVEGVFRPGQTCLIIDDVILSGSTAIQTCNMLQKEKLCVRKTLFFLDRQQGGRENLLDNEISSIAVINIHNILKVLQRHQRIDEVTAKNVLNYLDSNRRVSCYNPPMPIIAPGGCPRALTIKDRASKIRNPLGRRLLTLIDEKKSNLCVAADVKTSEELLSLADKLGPYICLLKTHIDILSDFSQETAKTLKNLSAKHRFFILEDRIFSDVGNTVKLQYSGGPFRIFDWAHLVSIHGMPGPGIIQGLLSVCSEADEERGCVIVAEMSSLDNLNNSQYSDDCVKMAKNWHQFVVGLMCQSRLTTDQDFILFTAGVNNDISEGALGQNYTCPEDAVLERGADVVIIGRAIIKDEDPVAKAMEYRDRSYEFLFDKYLDPNPDEY